MNHLFKALGASLVLLVIMLGSAKGAEKNNPLWLLVAQSPIISKGALRVPISAIEELRASGKRDYVNLEIGNAEFLKGSAPKTFAIQWFSEVRDYAPDLPLLKQLNGREVVVFTLRGGPTGRGIYLAGHTPEALAPSSEVLIRNIQTEIERQKQLLAQFPKGIDEIPKSRIESVRRLIENMTLKGRAEAAFEEMLRLGQDIVPATIMLMDDRRAVTAEWLQIPNAPGHWEAYALYKPEKVVDALDGILGKITGQQFVNIVNGGTDEDRRDAVDGWRVYLYSR